MKNDLEIITSIVLQNQSINRDDSRTIAYGCIKDSFETIKNFVDTFPSDGYAISGRSAYTCQYLKSKSFNELNGTQRANFNAIKKMVASFAK